LKSILDAYCDSSGQLVSAAKCSIYISPNTLVDNRIKVCEALDIWTKSLNDRYLGLPPMVGIDRTDNFTYLIERVHSLISGWKEKIISMGGKEVLIKAVAQAIPVFAMTVFNIPKKICKGIHMLFHNYGGVMMLTIKGCTCYHGGKYMGFHDLHAFNTTVLAKQCWRLMEEPYSLCAGVLWDKYYPDGNLLNAQLKSGSSFTWQSVIYGIQTFNRGCIWRVGDGQQINIWQDPCIPTSPTRKVYTPRGSILLSKVSDLINPTGSWDEELIYRRDFLGSGCN
jgi:hypothetical protein